MHPFNKPEILVERSFKEHADYLFIIGDYSGVNFSQVG